MPNVRGASSRTRARLKQAAPPILSFFSQTWKVEKSTMSSIGPPDALPSRSARLFARLFARTVLESRIPPDPQLATTRMAKPCIVGPFRTRANFHTGSSVFYVYAAPLSRLPTFSSPFRLRTEKMVARERQTANNAMPSARSRSRRETRRSSVPATA